MLCLLNLAFDQRIFEKIGMFFSKENPGSSKRLSSVQVLKDMIVPLKERVCSEIF